MNGKRMKFRKVYPMRPQGRARVRSSRRRGDELDALFGNGKLRKWAATLLAGVLFASIMLAILLVTGPSGRSGGRAAVIPAAQQGQRPDPTVRRSQPREARSHTPLEVAQRFLHAESDEERMKWVANPDLVKSILSEFYSSGPGREEQVDAIDPMPDVSSDEGFFARFAVSLNDGRKRMLCLPFRSGGEALVDFKSYSRHGSVPWDSLLGGKVEKADEMRLYLSKSDYYNHDFKDEARWFCLMGTSPDLESGIYLYVDRRDPSFQSLLDAPPLKPTRHTVAIGTLGGSSAKRQFILSRIIRTGWLEH